MPEVIQIGNKLVGKDQPCFITAEIGINHNANLSITKQLIDVASLAGCDAVKFQKRTPEKAVPVEYQNVMRETPWGIMSYLDYRRRMEFDHKEYAVIDRYCKEKGILWYASCWDEESVDFMEEFEPPCYKAASASLTDTGLLLKMKNTGRPLIISTGMSTFEEIDQAVQPEELNLRMINTLQDRFPVPVGYSGHEVGLQTTLAAVTLGASFVERHITLDRAMWGSDQAASVEPGGVMRLVRDIRVIERALGDGVKRVYDSELKARQKLRRK